METTKESLPQGTQIANNETKSKDLFRKDRISLVDFLKEKINGMTKEQRRSLDEMIGVDPAIIYRLKHGQKQGIHLITALKILRYLEVDMRELNRIEIPGNSCAEKYRVGRGVK